MHTNHNRPDFIDEKYELALVEIDKKARKYRGGLRKLAHFFRTDFWNLDPYYPWELQSESLNILDGSRFIVPTATWFPGLLNSWTMYSDIERKIQDYIAPYEAPERQIVHKSAIGLHSVRDPASPHSDATGRIVVIARKLSAVRGCDRCDAHLYTQLTGWE